MECSSSASFAAGRRCRPRNVFVIGVRVGIRGLREKARPRGHGELVVGDRGLRVADERPGRGEWSKVVGEDWGEVAVETGWKLCCGATGAVSVDITHLIS